MFKNLKSIITSGYIMNKETIKNNNIDVELINEKNSNLNGDDRVSLCFNPYDTVLYDDIKDKYDCCTCDIAYDMFVKNSIACIFSKRLITDSVIPESIDNRQQDEIQIVGNIPFNYVRGIALNDNFNSLDTYKELANLLTKNNINLPIMKTYRSGEYSLYGKVINSETLYKNTTNSKILIKK